METADLTRHALSLALAGVLFAGCGGLGSPITAPGSGSLNAATVGELPGSRTPIKHIVVLVQESRTFNDLFATTKVGCILVGHGKRAKRKTIPLQEVSLVRRPVLENGYKAYLAAYDHGTMCGFSLGGNEGRAPYQYVNPAQIQPYLTAAADYALADHMFQTQGSGDFTAHQDLIRGGTKINSRASIIDQPSRTPWGCDGVPGTRTNIIVGQKYKLLEGPFPCFTYETLQTLLDAKSVSWKYYVQGRPSYWNAFSAIRAVALDPRERSKHISSPETNVFRDIADGKLPAMSWVIPDLVNSDAPGTRKDRGPAWVASVVNAIGDSSYWDSAAIVIVWDDWGGLYDPIPPPFRDDQGGAGFRVPMIVISPYVPQGEVSHTVYGFGSIVRFIEDTWSLGRLGTTDETSTGIGNVFDFHQVPRQFVAI